LAIPSLARLAICEKDRHLEGKVVNVTKYDMTIVPGQEQAQCQVRSLNSADYEREATLTPKMTYDEEREID
jgi:hypothetical protein